MARLLPVTRHSSASRLVNEVIEKTTMVGQVDKFIYARAMRELDALQGVDVVAAEGMRALLYGAAGEDENAEASLLNAERNNGHHLATENRLKFLVNRMRLAEATDLSVKLLLDRGPVSFANVIDLAAVVGQFRQIVQALDRSIAGNEVVQATKMFTLSRRAVLALDQAGVSDVQIRRVVSLVGEVGRGHNLVWLNSLPDFSVLTGEEGGPLVSICFRVDMTPEQATHLNWELVEKMVDSDLMVSGFSMAFIGEPVSVAFPSLV